jgi:hypothetical protein
VTERQEGAAGKAVPSCIQYITSSYHDGMVRTQVQLTEEQLARLRRASTERGLSVAALIRDAIDRALADERHARDWELALSVVGKYRDVDGATDVSTVDDDYLVDAYEDWRR